MLNVFFMEERCICASKWLPPETWAWAHRTYNS